jgi:hypothetical protein
MRKEQSVIFHPSVEFTVLAQGSDPNAEDKVISKPP